jgi:RNA polymerase sigma factor (sigma-70 family)
MSAACTDLDGLDAAGYLRGAPVKGRNRVAEETPATPSRRGPVIRQEAELRALLTSGLSGSAADYRRFLERLGPHLRAYFKGKLARSGRGAAEAEDLVQETLMAVHTRRHTYDVAQPVTPWVYAIARYKLIDHLRRTRAGLADLPIEDASELGARDEHAATESTLDVERLLAHLPGKMRQAVRAMKLEGLSAAEAAERSGMSESAVKVSVHRGLKAMAGFVGGRRG